MSDPSNGYEAIAPDFIAHRGSSQTRDAAVGVRTLRAWSKTVRPGGAVLDLGCGAGDPITHILIDAGFTVYAVDASPTMVAAFRSRFPDVSVECNSVERSDFFGRRFDGVVAWGLVFLLQPDVQRQLISKVARSLAPGGRFVFTSPRQVCEWNDVMTRQRSESLGADAYRRLLETSGLIVTDETEDEGENYYYMSIKPR